MARVSGSMNRDWISQVRRDPAAGALVSEHGKEAMLDAEAYMQTVGAMDNAGWDYYYGSAELNGRNGRTFVFWPTNDRSMDDADAAFTAARSAGLMDADEAKRRRN